ncbi:hypothetical protein RF11_03151 [Thelohanellus kitauei]|uniref:Uncharacterized protein n=1 Tax=Thelohanellus kitauei TaxID=669202 RepID=A0A0C2JB37_THEKT|nr:hypothetical protein RF11_03151 [Thelohanellus kitauei]
MVIDLIIIIMGWRNSNYSQKFSLRLFGTELILLDSISRNHQIFRERSELSSNQINLLVLYITIVPNSALAGTVAPYRPLYMRPLLFRHLKIIYYTNCIF